jgi:hypothetical protein
MDESRTYSITNRFDPPEEGMMPGESIVWTRRAGFGFWIMCLGLSVFIVGPIIAFDFQEDFGLGNLEATIIIALVIITLIFVILSLIQTRRTRYYLTSERLLVVRGGNILKEIPLHHFAGKRLSQFLESSVMYTSNGRPIYRIRIYDPVTDESIEFKGQSEDSVEVFQQIGDMRECPYCNFDNTALSSRCKNCGAVL